MARRTQRLQIFWLIETTLPYRYDMIDIILLEFTGEQTTSTWVGAPPPLLLRNPSAFRFGAWATSGSCFDVTVFAFLNLLELIADFQQLLAEQLFEHGIAGKHFRKLCIPGR
jgi:hypothetical protein